MVGGACSERRGQRFLEPDANRHEHFTNEVFFRWEVVHNDSIADTDPFRDTAEAETGKAVVERRQDRTGEDLLLGVFVTHKLS